MRACTAVRHVLQAGEEAAGRGVREMGATGAGATSSMGAVCTPCSAGTYSAAQGSWLTLLGLAAGVCKRVPPSPESPPAPYYRDSSMTLLWLVLYFTSNS